MNIPDFTGKRSLVTLNETAWVDDLWDRAVKKLRISASRIGASFPHVSRNGIYDSADIDWWTNGFWPGLLWLVYRENKDPVFRDLAEKCESMLDPVIWKYDGLHHDIGFMWTLTSVAQYKLVGSDSSRCRALLVASVLAGRFNIKGGYIRAWNDCPGRASQAGLAIVDCLMNLPILFWASSTCNDPRFYHIATAHADTALNYVLRPDGSARHILSFDPYTGKFIEPLAGQGYGKESGWSRGCAWAIYGFSLCYRYTREEKYLEAAQRAARYFISNLSEESIPVWDFKAPSEHPPVWDSSAGACAASGLLELAHLSADRDAIEFVNSAKTIVRALNEKCAVWEHTEEGLLRFATGNRPANVNVGVPVIYGDYFFVEALAKLRGWSDTFW